MTEPGESPNIDLDYQEKKTPWGLLTAIAVGIGIIVLVVFMNRQKKNEEARVAVLTVMDKELVAQEEDIKAQRQKVMDLTRQIDEMRSAIQMGQVKNGKAAVADFNKLAAQQRAERDKFAQMAEDYNKKVAKFHELEQ